jgi:hypothetical protein
MISTPGTGQEEPVANVVVVVLAVVVVLVLVVEVTVVAPAQAARMLKPEIGSNMPVLALSKPIFSRSRRLSPAWVISLCTSIVRWMSFSREFIFSSLYMKDQYGYNC